MEGQSPPTPSDRLDNGDTCIPALPKPPSVEDNGTVKEEDEGVGSKKLKADEQQKDKEGETDKNSISSLEGKDHRNDNNGMIEAIISNDNEGSYDGRGEHHNFNDSGRFSVSSVDLIASSGHSIIYTLMEENSDVERSDSSSDGFGSSADEEHSGYHNNNGSSHNSNCNRCHQRRRGDLGSRTGSAAGSMQDSTKRRDNLKKGVSSDSTKETKFMGEESGSGCCDNAGVGDNAGPNSRGPERIPRSSSRASMNSSAGRRRRGSFPLVDSQIDKIQDMTDKMVENVVETVDPASGKNDPDNKREYAFAMCIGLILTFNMGFLNGACFSGFVVASGTKQAVGAFTNPYTDAALQLAAGNYHRVKFQCIMILCFVGGGFVSGVVTPNAVPYRIEPTYGPSFLAAGVALCLASYFAALENEHQNDVAFYLAAAAAGIQNGITSAYTAKLIRSTGLTGSSTDIGLYLGQYVRGNKENRTKLLILIILAFSFTLGGLISFYVTQIFTSYSLLIGAGLFLVIGISITIFLVQKLSISFRSAMFGTWKWQAAADGIKEAFGEHFGDFLDMDGSQPKAMADKEIFEMFDRIDADGSGTIDREELYILLRSTGAQVTRQESDMMFQYADKDGNGELDREEWKFVVETALAGRRSMLEMTKTALESTVETTRRNLKASYEIMGSSARHLVTSTRSLGSNSTHTKGWTGRLATSRAKKDSSREEAKEEEGERNGEEANHKKASKGDVVLEEAPKGD